MKRCLYVKSAVLFIAIVLLIGLFAGCSSTSSKEQDTSTVTSTESTKVQNKTKQNEPVELSIYSWMADKVKSDDPEAPIIKT